MPSAYDEYFRPITSKWVELVRKGIDAKKPFQEVAEQCAAHFSGRNGFIFEKEYRERYLGLTNANQLPKHRLSLNKSHELVAIFTPMLAWDNPERNVKPRKMLQFGMETLGITPQMQQMWQQYQQATQQYQQAMQQGPPPPQPPQPGQPPAPPPQPPQPPPPIDPQIQQMMQLWDWSQMTQSQRAVSDAIRCQLLEGWLNYIPNEMPEGGLAAHTRLAIIEALVKGRGVLWTEPYTMPGSEKRLIGSFFDTVDNLFIDPDATNLSDAKWIAKRVTKPVYDVEEEFKLTPGSLEGKGASELGGGDGKKMNPIGTPDSQSRKDKVGRTSELLTYYKIWTKCGVGTKLIGQHVDPEMKANLERVSGKYAFLCIADGVDYPLNVPADQLEAMSDDDVRERLEWPFPTWKDDRFPCSMLDFYQNPNRVWPIAPLAPALGVLTFLQFIMSHMADRVVKSSRDFIGVLQSAGEEIEEAIKNGGDLTVLKLTEVHQDISKVVQFLQQPNAKQDMWELMSRMEHVFERCTGLTEMMAGQTSTQSRSAADANIKGQQINVRPDDMQRQVEKWQTEVAALEAIATRWFIEPQDVEFLFGPVGAHLWQTYITNTDPELTIRETECTIVAGSGRRPDKQKDTQDFQTLAQFIAQPLVGLYQQTGNSGPLMWLLNQMADTFSFDISGLNLTPPPQQPPQQPPQPDPMQQLEMQKMQVEMQGQQQKMGFDAQKMQFDGQMLQQKAGLEGQKLQLELAKLQGEMQLQQAELAAKQSESQASIQKSFVDQQLGQQTAETAQQQLQGKLAADAAHVQIEQMKGQQQLEIAGAQAAQQLQAAEMKNQMTLAHQAQQAKIKQQQMFSDPIEKLFGDKKE